MKAGVQYCAGMDPEAIIEAGFSYIEYPAQDIESAQGNQKSLSGIEAALKGLNGEQFFALLQQAEQTEANYIVLQTAGCSDDGEFLRLIEECSMAVADFPGEIYIENGYLGSDADGYLNGWVSDVKRLKRLCQYGNDLTGREMFGVCLNIGYANLLERNIRVMIGYLGSDLKLVHVNDNDGRRNLRQMPYTFTTGRGKQSTDWNRILGALIKLNFDGWLIFDTVGLFTRTPGRLHPAMLELLYAVKQKWEEQFHYEDILNQPDKKIILFGAGAMAYNYMQVWGKKYPPAFIVDNYDKRWGTKLEGIEVKKPDAILEVPAQERLVLICNMFYNEMKKQLSAMGVEYQFYCDEYYM